MMNVDSTKCATEIGTRRFHSSCILVVAENALAKSNRLWGGSPVGLDVRSAGGFVNEDEMRGRMRESFLR